MSAGQVTVGTVDAGPITGAPLARCPGCHQYVGAHGSHFCQPLGRSVLNAVATGDVPALLADTQQMLNATQASLFQLQAKHTELLAQLEQERSLTDALMRKCDALAAEVQRLSKEAE